MVNSKDDHWNEEGHKYAAEVLYENLIRSGMVRSSQQSQKLARDTVR